MDNAVQVILKKLEDIDQRLSRLENPNLTETISGGLSEKTKNTKRDPLFPKALEIINKYDEISSNDLAKELKIDVKRAEEIMDQLEAAGIGVCYTKEV
ncbi:MAG: hypothetical protein KatS3mg092_0683 [Patescibacteria group bacterium]|nr:MAG: hypothetical protein KatS3mg092_0683 [Patescibacteria group bacterium]